MDNSSPIVCDRCGSMLEIDIKRVGPRFAVIAQCCGAEQVVSPLYETHVHPDLEICYENLRNGKYNRRKRERRRQ